MQLTADQLIAILTCRPARATMWLAPLQQTLSEFEITTPRRMAAFIAQIGHESGRLIYVREIWGPTALQRAYEPPGRKATELGNTQPGDGMLYRGRGLIQTTGRGNYCRARDQLRKRFPSAPDFEASPQLLEQPQWAALSAGQYWDDHGLNALADACASAQAEQFETLTRRINGGVEGLAERQAFFTAGLRIL